VRPWAREVEAGRSETLAGKNWYDGFLRRTTSGTGKKAGKSVLNEKMKRGDLPRT